MLRDFAQNNSPVIGLVTSSTFRYAFSKLLDILSNILSQIRPFKCARNTYQSFEDWRGLRDIVRCNPCFHGRPRYDCIRTPRV
ncbi:hypothetical protein C8F04DRAFT_942289 [Mycena alexandri]|uniref:Uncharacterized protein n=1 Tax=Mycena alexandri TaxID=1745969 RepID=A0AAD6TER7_9AGAR|nr:hypothetical protein C8F04DRAFT_942289 [Mycena alexandri]